jgi:outer membrane receptor protein involved in Fe transport
LKGLELRANVTLASSVTDVVQNNIYVKNNIKVVEPIDTITRQMSGQAPYVINGILSYTLDSLRLTASIAYNVQGPRLAVVSTQPELIPDVYELQRHLLDFRVAKQIGKRFTITVTVKDILNSPVKRSYKLPEGFTVDFDSYRFGTNYNLSISFKI